jgi:non-ribosomal peptide synthetase component F
VIDGGRTWTYRQIDAAADEGVAALRDRVGAGDLVGVCLDRSAALVVTAVAIARLGAVYLPLGPRPGERRVDAVTEDLGVACLIGTPAVLPARHREAEHIPLPLPDGGVNAAGAVVAAFAPSRPGALRAPHEAFYAVLTSGSTGRPKAVVVAEPALCTLLDWYRAETGLAPGDRQSLLIGVAFDPHLLELWAGLTSGAARGPAPDDVRWDIGALTSWWREAAVSVAVAATPMVEPLLERPWPHGLVPRRLVVGGDRMRRRPGADVTATVHNAYGPAEATVVTTTYAMRAADAGAEGPGAPPTGAPVPGVTVVVTGPDGRPVARGEEGELRIGGSGLALGYVDCELTARRFTAPAPAPGVDLPGWTGSTAPAPARRPRRPARRRPYRAARAPGAGGPAVARRAVPGHPVHHGPRRGLRRPAPPHRRGRPAHRCGEHPPQGDGHARSGRPVRQHPPGARRHIRRPGLHRPGGAGAGRAAGGAAPP